MATVTAFEAKTRFKEVLDQVAKGEEVVITRHDKRSHACKDGPLRTAATDAGVTLWD